MLRYTKFFVIIVWKKKLIAHHLGRETEVLVRVGIEFDDHSSLFLALFFLLLAKHVRFVLDLAAIASKVNGLAAAFVFDVRQ